MGLRSLERRLERLVEGAFARVFRSGLRPVELGRGLTRAMDDHRSVGVGGETVVPNRFTVHLAAEDADSLVGVRGSLARELAEVARDHAREQELAFMGPVEVALVGDGRQGPGRFEIDAEWREQPGGGGVGSLVTPAGDRIALRGPVFRIGRLSDCELTLPDPNVSRRHAELRPVEGSWVLTDLGSMNGTRCNGGNVSEHRLRDGDEIGVGHHVLRFEAS